MTDETPKPADDSRAVSIFPGRPGETFQEYYERRVASFARFMEANPDWSPPALNRPRDRADSEINGASRGRGWAS